MSSTLLEDVQTQLRDVQLEVDETLEKLIKVVETVEVSADDKKREEINVQQHTLEELRAVKSLIEELESLETQGNLDGAFLKLQDSTARVQKFSSDHPQALLTVDLERRLNDTGKRIRHQLQSEWDQSVSVNTTESAFEIKLAITPTLFETVTLYMPNLIEQFLVSLAPAFDAVINREVREVLEDEHSVELSREGNCNDVLTLIDVVQTLVLAFGGVLSQVPDLQARIARRYGHYLVENFVHKSFPALFPENSEDLSLFKKDVAGLRGLEDVMTTEGWTKGRELSMFADSFDAQWILSRQNHYLSRLRDSLSGEYKVDSWDWDGEDFDDGEDSANEEQSLASREKVLDILQEYAWELDVSAESYFAVFRALAPRYYRNYPMILYVETLRLLGEASSLQLRPESLEATESFAHDILAEVLSDNASLLDKLLYVIKPCEIFNPSAADAVMRQVDKIAQSSGDAGPQIREHVVSQAVEQVATYLIRSVEALEDISEAESHNIATNINAFRGCSAYFDNISTSVPSWVKLQRLESIVQARLDDIAQMTASGMLSDFSAAELEGLITALFVDSSHRQQVLDLVTRVCI